MQIYYNNIYNMADYTIGTDASSSTLSIRTIYDNATPTLTEGSNAILQYSDVKMEFFLGTARTNYLPYRLNRSSYYQGGGWWGTYTGAANGFVANISNAAHPQFPCIGSKISGNPNDEGDVSGNWLAFHPAQDSSNNVTLRLAIKITPQNNKTITGYTLYYQDKAPGGLRIETGHNTTRHQYDMLNPTVQSDTANWSYIGAHDGYQNVFRYTKELTSNIITSNDFLYLNIDEGINNFSADAATMKMILNTTIPGTITPTPLTFVNNTLTIANDITSTDTDIVSFQLPAGSIMYSFNVTGLLNTNIITYSLDISGGANVFTGTISTTGVNLLGENNLTPAVDTTYILTLTSGSTNTYTIIGKMLGPGYTFSSVLAAGGMFPWNSDDTTNRLKQSYVKDFIDISGSLVLRNNANLYVEGNTTVNGKLMLNNTNLQADLSFNNRILVGSDMSMNGNATIANDVSLNGFVTGCIFNNNSIPTNAFEGTVTSGGPDYTKASVIYQQKFRADGDVSMNGSTVQATNITVNGNIEFNDGTKMTTYDDNIQSNSIISGKTTTTFNSTTNSTPVNSWMASSEDGKYVYMVTGRYAAPATGKLFISTDYGVNWTESSYNFGTTPYFVSGIDTSTDGKYIITGTSSSSTRSPANTNQYHVSSNYGVSWTSFSGSFGGASKGLAGVAMSSTGQYMVAATCSQSNQFMWSNNYGVNWYPKTGFYEGPWIEQNTWLKMSYDGQYIYGGKFPLEYRDATNAITNVTSDFTGATIYDGGSVGTITISVSKRSKLMAYTNTTSNSSVFISTNGIKPISTVAFPVGGDPRCIHIDKNDTIFIGVNTTIYKSTDNGTSWSQYTIDVAPVANIGHLYVTPKYTFLGLAASIASSYGRYPTPPITYTRLTHVMLAVYKPSTFSNLTIIGALRYGTLNSTSDYRIKNNAAKLDNTFTVDNLRPVKYFQTLLNKQQYGLIAHELQQYYPDLVLGEKDGHNLQSVNYTGLIAILINEINQLKRVVAEEEQKRQTAQSTQHM